MAVAKTFFQQIPVETVKRIAREFPEKDASTPDSDDVKPPMESWRALAEQVQREPDAAKMIDLVQELISKIDEDRSSKSAPFAPGKANR